MKDPFSSPDNLRDTFQFQTFLRDKPLPVAALRWRHNGGSDSYATHCERFEHMDAAWEYIADLHAREVSYNLLYFPGCLFCLPRKRQGSYALPQWSGGQGWYEMVGGVVVVDT